MPAKQKCPICNSAVAPSPRYPRYVCRNCAARAQSAEGRAVEFFNRDFFGGFVGKYADTGKAYKKHDCFIDGVRCYADEARFGGIVIQAVDRSANKKGEALTRYAEPVCRALPVHRAR